MEGGSKFSETDTMPNEFGSVEYSHLPEQQRTIQDPYVLWEKMRALQQAEFLSQDEIAHLVEQLPDDAIEKTYREVILAIQKQTKLFSDLEDIGIYENLLDHSFVTLAGVKVHSDDSVKIPSYIRGFNVILFDTRATGKRELLRELSSGDGNFIETMLHETLHGVQEKKTNALVKIFNYVKSGGAQARPGVEISEAQAYETGFSLQAPWQKKDYPSLGDAPSLEDYLKNFNEAESAIEEVGLPTSGVPQAEQVDTKKFVEAYVLVQRLRALKFSATDIATLIAKKGNWYPKTRSYDELEKFVAKTAREYFGLAENSPYEADLDGLVDARKIESTIERLKARKLAQGVLLRNFNTLNG